MSKLNKQQQRRIKAANAGKIDRHCPENSAVVVSHLGYRLILEHRGQLLSADWRRQSADIACNDRVLIQPVQDGHAVVETVLPRGKTLYKQQGRKIKPVAANIDCLLIVITCEPDWQESLVDRYLIAARKAGIRPALLFNKTDLLGDSAPENQPRLKPYQALDLPIFYSALPTIPPALQNWLAGKQTVLCGQSGVGKSSLIRALKPDCEIWIQALSHATKLGKHTTTNLRRYPLDADTAVIDTPGVRSFAVNHPERADILAAFPDIAPYIRQCRFNDCNHRHTPGCAVEQALNAQAVSPARCRSLLQLLEETP